MSVHDSTMATVETLQQAVRNESFASPRTPTHQSSLQAECDLLSKELKENSQLEAILHGLQVVLPSPQLCVEANTFATGKVDAPITPAVSPVSSHGGGNGHSVLAVKKRPRLPSAEVLEMVLDENKDSHKKQKRICGFSLGGPNGEASCAALLVIDPHLQKELESRTTKSRVKGSNGNLNRRKKKKQPPKQLNYFAIASAFHRAAMERNNEIW